MTLLCCVFDGMDNVDSAANMVAALSPRSAACGSAGEERRTTCREKEIAGKGKNGKRSQECEGTCLDGEEHIEGADDVVVPGV